MSKNILIPIDGSEYSNEALSFAIEEYPSSQITVVHVVNPDDLFTSPGIEGRTSGMISYEQIQEKHKERAEDLLETARKQASEDDIDIKTEALVGDVSKAVLDYAEEHDIDHIIVGSRGRTGAGRILLGSVAEKIARRSPVPVTIAR